MDIQIELFWDNDQGGFFFTSNDHESLIARAKDPFDGVRPAGNSVSVENLVTLAAAMDRPQYLELAEKTIQSVTTVLHKAPSGLTRMATAFPALLEARLNQAAAETSSPKAAQP